MPWHRRWNWYLSAPVRLLLHWKLLTGSFVKTMTSGASQKVLIWQRMRYLRKLLLLEFRLASNVKISLLRCRGKESSCSGPKDDDEEVAQEFSSLPDSDQLMHLILKPNVMEPFRSEASRSPKDGKDIDGLPDTLREALTLSSCPFTSLRRLAIRLRTGRGGADTAFLKNARNCRRASKSLNWYQLLATK